MKPLNRILLVASLLGLALPAQEKETAKKTASEAPATTLRWVGCGISKKAFMQALADGYQKETGVEIKLEGGGATRGIREVSAGKADLGGTCRHKLDLPEESNAVLYPVGWDAIVAIVHPSNPVKSISFSQLKKVLTGEITNWNQLGGRSAKIQVFTRSSSSSGVGLMARELIFWDPKVDFEGSSKEFPSSGPLERALEETPNAIALTGVSSARKRKVKVLAINRRQPTAKNIMTGAYPVVRPLYLVANKEMTPAVDKFVKWTTGPGQKLIQKEGTVTLAQGKKLWSRYSKLMRGIKLRQMRAAARPPK